MEGFNKILSLFVGLFVVIIVGFLLVKRFNLQQSWPLLGGNTAQPTPSASPAGGSPTPAQNVVAMNTTAESLKEKFGDSAKKTETKTIIYKNNSADAIARGEKTAFEAVANNGYRSTDIQAQKGVTMTTASPQQIPETGLPTLFLPLAFSGFLGGAYLKRKFQ